MLVKKKNKKLQLLVLYKSKDMEQITKVYRALEKCIRPLLFYKGMCCLLTCLYSHWLNDCSNNVFDNFLSYEEGLEYVSSHAKLN